MATFWGRAGICQWMKEIGYEEAIPYVMHRVAQKRWGTCISLTFSTLDKVGQSTTCLKIIRLGKAYFAWVVV